MYKPYISNERFDWLKPDNGSNSVVNTATAACPRVRLAVDPRNEYTALTWYNVRPIRVGFSLCSVWCECCPLNCTRVYTRLRCPATWWVRPRNPPGPWGTCRPVRDRGSRLCRHPRRSTNCTRSRNTNTNYRSGVVTTVVIRFTLDLPSSLPPAAAVYSKRHTDGLGISPDRLI